MQTPQLKNNAFSTLLVAVNVMLEKGLIDQKNARLIATAPELLEALEKAEAWFHDVRGYYVPEVGFDAVCENIRDTIKKAKGE